MNSIFEKFAILTKSIKLMNRLIEITSEIIFTNVNAYAVCERLDGVSECLFTCSCDPGGCEATYKYVYIFEDGNRSVGGIKEKRPINICGPNQCVDTC